MARERELPLRREDANAIIRTGHPWLQEKGRLAKVRPIGEGAHLRISQCIRANNDGQRVAEQRARCEHVDLLKREIGHVAAPLD
jgi:hypothetical protein